MTEKNSINSGKTITFFNFLRILGGLIWNYIILVFFFFNYKQSTVKQHVEM